MYTPASPVARIPAGIWMLGFVSMVAGAATGLVYPVWAMAAMAASVTAIFLNSLWGRPRLFVDAILSVGRPAGAANPQAAEVT